MSVSAKGVTSKNFRLPFLRQLQTTGNEPCRREALQVHVHERATEVDLAGELTDVGPPARERRQDPKPVRARQCREEPHELVSADLFELLDSIVFHVSENLHVTAMRA